MLLIFSLLGIIYSFQFGHNQYAYIRFAGRYSKYVDLLQYKNTEIIDDLSSYVKIPSETVKKDLQTAIDHKLIPQGHFNSDERIIMLSNGVFSKYQLDPTGYDYYYKKVWENHRRLEERPPEVTAILEEGNNYVSKIRTFNDLIKDKNVSRQLDHIEKTVAAIFYEVDIDYDQAEKIGSLMYIYLPTMEKLLNTYVDIDTRRTSVSNAKKTKEEIAESLQLFNNIFDNTLNSFFAEKELDIASDIAAIEKTSTQEQMSNS